MRWFFIFTAVVAALVVGTLLVGLFLPRAHAAAVSLFVPAPPARVWAVLSDPSGYPRWRPSVDAVDVLSGQSTRWRERAVTGESVWEVEERVPQRRLRTRMVEHELPFLRRWSWEIAAEEGGTRVVLTEEGETRHPFYRFLLRFVVGHRAAVSEALRGLRDHVGAA